MKKRPLLRKILFGLLVIILLFIYLWIYIFPSIGAVNRTKREIREHSLLIRDARVEKLAFLESDKKERLLFREAAHEFNARMRPPDGAGLEPVKSLLREIGEKAGISGLRFSEEENIPDDSERSSTGGITGIQVNPLSMEFYAGLRYGADFIGLLNSTAHYILFNDMEANRSGSGFTFKVNTDILFTGKEDEQRKKKNRDEREELIDMDSPILRQPVHQSAFRIKKSGSGENKGPK